MTLRTYTVIIITIALCLVAWFVAKSEAPPHTNPGHSYIITGKIGLEWLFHGESRVWLEAMTIDREGWKDDGWNPSFTLLVCHYKPIVKKVGDKYEITFTQGDIQLP